MSPLNLQRIKIQIVVFSLVKLLICSENFHAPKLLNSKVKTNLWNFNRDMMSNLFFSIVIFSTLQCVKPLFPFLNYVFNMSAVQKKKGVKHETKYILQVMSVMFQLFLKMDNLLAELSRAFFFRSKKVRGRQLGWGVGGARGGRERRIGKKNKQKKNVRMKVCWWNCEKKTSQVELNPKSKFPFNAVQMTIVCTIIMVS